MTSWSTSGRIIAVGIPGASAISAVGTFLAGGPIHDNPAFAAYTQPGRILDPVRILVGSRSNFGAPVANSDQCEGAFLSIDPRGTEALVIPRALLQPEARRQSSEGACRCTARRALRFLNGINNPKAVTADFTGVSNPLGFSINNAFGRLWPANAPNGLYGIGTSTILGPERGPASQRAGPDDRWRVRRQPHAAAADTGSVRWTHPGRGWYRVSRSVAGRLHKGGV